MFTALIAGPLRDAKRMLGAAVAVPSACAICHAWPSQPICDACIARFAAHDEPRCRRCAIALPAAAAMTGRCGRCTGLLSPPLDACVAAVGWRWPWNECITHFKFGREPGRARTLAPLLRAAPGAAALLSDADLVLPLPLSAQRLRERGFNQALELARRVAPAKTDARLLRRVRETPPQSSLARAARLVNVRGAFALDPARQHVIDGRRILLIDDVMTTGATLSEAARTLREAGALRVAALVLARADEAQSASPD